MKKFALLLALCITVSQFAGCDFSKKDNDQNVSIKWYFPGNPGYSDNNEVYTLASSKVKEKLGFGATFIPFELGSFGEKMKMIISSGENYDITWTSNWINDYSQNVSNGAYIELDKIIEEQAPELKSLIKKEIWDGTRINGKIYGVPTQQIMARSMAIVTPKSFYDKNSSLLENAKNYEDLEAYLEACTKDKPNFATMSFDWPDMLLSYGIEEILGAKVPGAIYIEGDKKDIKVFNQFESEFFKHIMKVRSSWTQKGYTVNALPSGQNIEETPSKNPIIVNTYKPGIEAEYKKNYEIVAKQISPAYLTTSGIMATLNAISAESKNPEKAMQLLQYINTDKDINNLLVYGIEDKHYVKVDDKTISLTDESKYSNYNWVLGNTFNLFVREGAKPTIWEETRKINDTANPSRLLGFSADSTPVALELNNCKSAITEYWDSLEAGIGNTDELITSLQQKLKTAGSDKIIAELQRQADEWVKK